MTGGRSAVERGVRTLVVGVPDWPVAAAGLAPGEAAVVVERNRVVAVSAAARADGVELGLRRREAQARSPDAVVVAADLHRDIREFEPVVAAVAELCPRLEVIRPGWCGVPTRGPSRYFGGDGALAHRVQAVAQEVIGVRGTVQVGVADGRFAAELAAAGAVEPVVVAAGTSATWLAPKPIAVLIRPEGAVSTDLVELLRRLGLHTLGALAALPLGNVVARFGPEGIVAHRLASGLDDRPFRMAPPSADLAVEMTLDPPVERVDVATFAARSLAVELHQRLQRRGEVCACVAVAAETEHGERWERRWRHGAASSDAVVERVRWQLEGWLQGPPAVRPTAGITVLRLVPEEVAAATGTQLPLWGSAATVPDRVMRAVARLEGMLGPEAVTVPEWRGGRHAVEQVVTVPFATVQLDGHSRPPREVRDPDRPPWPGQLPAVSPTIVFADTERHTAEVVDETGAPVCVDGRAVLSAPPTEVSIAGGRRQRITGWAGPWPAVERWWDPATRRRQARFQVTTDDGTAYLLMLQRGQWSLAAIYD